MKGKLLTFVERHWTPVNLSAQANSAVPSLGIDANEASEDWVGVQHVHHPRVAIFVALENLQDKHQLMRVACAASKQTFDFEFGGARVELQNRWSYLLDQRRPHPNNKWNKRRFQALIGECIGRDWSQNVCIIGISQLSYLIYIFSISF